jgi:hypothetical protein
MIGVFSGVPIVDTITDRFGRRFVFVGLAPRQRDGDYDAEMLKTGEFILEPGLLYRLDTVPGLRRQWKGVSLRQRLNWRKIHGFRNAAFVLAISLTSVLAAGVILVTAR